MDVTIGEIASQLPLHGLRIGLYMIAIVTTLIVATVLYFWVSNFFTPEYVPPGPKLHGIPEEIIRSAEEAGRLEEFKSNCTSELICTVAIGYPDDKPFGGTYHKVKKRDFYVKSDGALVVRRRFKTPLVFTNARVEPLSK